jgi:hypothetical protein
MTCFRSKKKGEHLGQELVILRHGSHSYLIQPYHIGSFCFRLEKYHLYNFHCCVSQFEPRLRTVVSESSAAMWWELDGCDASVTLWHDQSIEHNSDGRAILLLCGGKALRLERMDGQTYEMNMYRCGLLLDHI